MKIKFSPCKWNPNAPHSAGVLPDTTIVVQDENTILVDGEPYAFSPDDMQWDDAASQTDDVITAAHREGGVLYLTIRRFYTGSYPSWDDGQYHEVTACK